MIILNGEEVHKCTECGDSFGQGVHLKGHTLTHSGEKEHKCTECGNLYGQPGNLKRHMFTHGGKKQYKCTQFDYVSSQADNLRYHIKTYFYKNICLDYNTLVLYFLSKRVMIFVLYMFETFFLV